MYGSQSSERRPLPRLNVALVVADAEAIDAQMCTRLLAHTLRTSTTASSADTAEIVAALLTARAVHGGAALPAESPTRAPEHLSGTLETAESPTKGGPPTEGSSRRRGSPSSTRTGSLATPAVADGSAQLESGRRRAYLAQHWPLSELVVTPDGARVVLVHALEGEDALIAAAEEASVTANSGGNEASEDPLSAVVQCGREACARLLAAVTAALATPTHRSPPSASTAALAELTVLWAVRHPCLLAAFAAAATSGAGGAALVPRAVVYLQPGADDVVPSRASEASSAGSAAAKRSTSANKSATTAGQARGGSANKGAAAVATAGSRAPARRNSGAGKGKASASAGGCGARGGAGGTAAEDFNFFFDRHTQRYEASTVARHLYAECQDFASFVERQRRFQDQLRQLQSWQLLAATSAFGTRTARPAIEPSTTALSPSSPSTTAAPAGTGGSEDPLDNPLTTTLFGHDGDRVCANGQAQRAHTARTDDTAASHEVLTLLEDCQLAARVPVPSVVALAAWQETREQGNPARVPGAAAVASSSTSSGAAPSAPSKAVAAAPRKKGAAAGTGSAAPSPTATTTAVTTDAPPCWLSQQDDNAAEDVLLPVWLLAPVSAGITSTASVMDTNSNNNNNNNAEAAGDEPGMVAMAAALPGLARRVATVVGPLLGAVHQYDQWSAPRPVYPLVDRALVRAGDTNAAAGAAFPTLRELDGAALCDTTTEAERVFFLGTTSTALLTEMVDGDEDAPAPLAQAVNESGRGTDPVASTGASRASGGGRRRSQPSRASPVLDPSRFTRYQELKRRAGVFTPLTATLALIAQTVTTLERTAPLRLVKLVQRGEAPASLLFATTAAGAAAQGEGSQDASQTPTAAELCEEAHRMGVRVEDSERGAHYASSPSHRPRTHITKGSGGFFRPYTHALLGRQGDNFGTTSVLPSGAAQRQRQAPNAALHGLVSAYARRQSEPQGGDGSAGQTSRPESRPSTARKKSSRSPSPAGRSGSRSGAAATAAAGAVTGARLLGVAALTAEARDTLKHSAAAARAERATAECAFVVPNDHTAEPPFPPPYPEEVQWLVAQYVKRGLGYFALTSTGGDTATAAIATNSGHSSEASTSNNAAYLLAVRRMRELEGVPIRLEVGELAGSLITALSLNANNVLRTASDSAEAEAKTKSVAMVSGDPSLPTSSAPPPPVTPLELVRRCAMPLSTFEVQLQRSVERSLTSRERQHALQKVLLVELARSAGLLSYTAVDEVASHTGSLCAIEEVVSLDVVHRELLRYTLRFGDHLIAIYDFKDKPPPVTTAASSSSALVNVLSDFGADGALRGTAAPTNGPTRTSAASHTAENVYPPRRAERMWVAGLPIPPLRRRQMVFVHPYLGRLGPEQLMAVKAALAATPTTTATTTMATAAATLAGRSSGTAPSTAPRLATALYAQLLQQHLDKRSFFIATRPSSYATPQPQTSTTSTTTREHPLQVPPLRVTAEGREIIYPYCDAVVEVTTTAIARRCSYVKEREITASLEYAIAPPPRTASAVVSDAPSSPESHTYLSVRFDDGLILTCTPQSVRHAASAPASVDSGAAFSPTGTARRARSLTENDLEATRPPSHRASFLDAAPPDTRRSLLRGTTTHTTTTTSTTTPAVAKSKPGARTAPSNTARGAASAATTADTTNGGDPASAAAARAVVARALAAPAAATAPIGPSGAVRLWHARLTPPTPASSTGATTTTTTTTARSTEEPTVASPIERAHSPRGRSSSLSGTRATRAAKDTVRSAAAIGIAVTTNNLVLRCHPTANRVSMHYFGEERRPGCLGGNGGTTSWESLDAVHQFRGAQSRVVSTVEREVTRSVDGNTGVVTRVFESGATQLLFPDGALSTRYPVEAIAAVGEDGQALSPSSSPATSPSSPAGATSPTLSHRCGTATASATSAGHSVSSSSSSSSSCVIELITSAAGIRYARRVTSHAHDVLDDPAADYGCSRVAHRCVRLAQPADQAVREVASYDAVHHCHMLSRSDGVCTTYYYRRPRSGGAGGAARDGTESSPGTSSLSMMTRMAVPTPSSTRKFGSRGADGADRSGDFDVVARVTLHADGTAITTFAAAGALSRSWFVSPALAPLLEDLATVEAACHGGQNSPVSVRWAVESARMPRVFLIPPPTMNNSNNNVGGGACALEGTVIPPFTACAHRARPTASAVGTTLGQHDAKAGFYIMLGDGTTLRRNVQMRVVGQAACPFLETVLSRPSSTAVRVVHDSAIAIIEPADAMASNRANPAALAVAECLPMFDLALGGMRLVDRRSYVTEVRDLFSPLDVALAFAPQSWQQLLRQLVSPTYSPHRLPKQKMEELEARQVAEAAADKLAGEAGQWPCLQRRLRDLAESYIVDNKLLHPDVLHNLARTRFIGTHTGPSDSGAESVPAAIKEDNHLISVSPLFFSRLACGEYVQYLGASNLQDILRQTDVEAGAPMFLSRGSASGEPGVQQLTLFRVCVESDSSDVVGAGSMLATTSLGGGAAPAGSPNVSHSATGTRRGVSTRVGAAKASSSYAQSSIMSGFNERQYRLSVLFSGTTPASNYLHSSAKGSPGYFLDNVVAHPVTVLRGSSRWLPPALQPQRRFLHRLPTHARGDDESAIASAANHGSISTSRGHRLVELEEDTKLAEDLRTGNTSSFELVRVFLEYEQLTLPAQNVVLQSELQRSSTLQELGRYHEAMTKNLAEVTSDKLDEQRRLQEIYYAARRAKKEQEAQQADRVGGG